MWGAGGGREEKVGGLAGLWVRKLWSWRSCGGENLELAELWGRKLGGWGSCGGGWARAEARAGAGADGRGGGAGRGGAEPGVPTDGRVEAHCKEEK